MNAGCACLSVSRVYSNPIAAEARPLIGACPGWVERSGALLICPPHTASQNHGHGERCGCSPGVSELNGGCYFLPHRCGPRSCLCAISREIVGLFGVILVVSGVFLQRSFPSSPNGCECVRRILMNGALRPLLLLLRATAELIGHPQRTGASPLSTIPT